MLRTLHCSIVFNRPLSLHWRVSFNEYEKKNSSKLLCENYKTLLCSVQSSPGFDRCFNIHAKKKENIVYFTHAGACSFLNVVCWFVYQNGSWKKIVFWLVPFFLTGHFFYFNFDLPGHVKTLEHVRWPTVIYITEVRWEFRLYFSKNSVVTLHSHSFSMKTRCSLVA